MNLLKRIIFLVVIVQMVEFSLGIDQGGSRGFINGNIISKLESDSTDIDCLCRRLRLLCQIGFACKEFRQKCKCTKPTTLTTSSSSIVTPDNYCPDCKQFCQGRNLHCMKKWDDYCTECSETCYKQGWDVFLFPIFALKAPVSKEELCNKCRNDGCDNYDPEEDENCSRYYCNDCEMSCRSMKINTSDPEVARCIACKEKCYNKNLGCSENLLEHCSQCGTGCGKLCDSESNCIYLKINFYTQRPWLPEWTKAELCEYCATKCIGWYPGIDDLDCELTRCNLCDENLKEECRSTVTTPSTMTIIDAWTDRCNVCKEKCHNKNLGCSKNLRKYCDECISGCWPVCIYDETGKSTCTGFDIIYFEAFPMLRQMTHAELCEYCSTTCIGWYPGKDDLDCQLTLCHLCDEKLQEECKTTVTTPRTLPTRDPATPYCVECREMCDGVDLGCSPNRLKYSQKCKFNCTGMFFDFVSIPTWPEWTKEQLCKFCTTKCVGWDPNVDDLDCSHRRCKQCSENVLEECRAFSSGQNSDQVTDI